MTDLIIRGHQSFMGKEIPVVVGGFGPDKRCVSDKTVAEIHGMETFNIRARITDNIQRFRENIDYIDLAQRVGDSHTLGNTQRLCEAKTLELLLGMGYSKQSITQAEHIYILSERGYLKLVKILNTDLAWDIYENLINDYFSMKEGKTVPPQNPFAEIDADARRMRAEAMALNAKNRAAKMMMEAYSEAGVNPQYKVLALREVYAPAGINIPIEGIRTEPKTYDATTIAKMLGVMSTGGLPHSHAVSALIEIVGVQDGESVRVPCQNQKSGHSDSTLQYTDAVVDRVRDWLVAQGYPTKIMKSDGSKTFTVIYKNQEVA